jgi:hypothetical protein
MECTISCVCQRIESSHFDLEARKSGSTFLIMKLNYFAILASVPRIPRLEPSSPASVEFAKISDEMMISWTRKCAQMARDRSQFGSQHVACQLGLVCFH